MDTPRLTTPPGACDTHMHVYETRFGTPVRAQFALPQAPMADYLAMQRRLGLARVIVVQANAYGDDNRGMLEAMRTAGDAARGVAPVSPDIGEEALLALHAAGVRGARFHMLPGGARQWPELEPVAERIAALGWHIQLQLDGHELPRHAARLRALPVELVIDHIGKFLDPGPPAPQDAAFRSLLQLLDTGRCWVKLSAPYESSRSGTPDYADVAPLARTLARRHPGRCLWASNWPHPAREPRPSDASLLDLLGDWTEDEATRRRILVDNPARLYGFDAPVEAGA